MIDFEFSEYFTLINDFYQFTLYAHIYCKPVLTFTAFSSTSTAAAPMSLAPSDSTQAMANLVSAYTDDDIDDDVGQDEPAAASNNGIEVATRPEAQHSASSPDSTHSHERTFAHFISDDEDRHSVSSSPHDSERPLSSTAGDQPVNKHLNIEPAGRLEQNTQSPVLTSYGLLERKPTLVSYATDEVDDMEDDDSEHSSDEPSSLAGIFGLINSKGVMARNVSAASILTRSEVAEATSADTSSPHSIMEDDIQLPPEPPGSCSKRLQEKLAKYHEQLKSDEKRLRRKVNFNREIQERKDFRNPSIYEKLVQFCGIDEKGTNYPPELYNPTIWGRDSYYDELARIQMEWIHEKEKESKKSKVEFQKGVKKVIIASAADAASTSDTKRKSKWDERGSASNSAVSAVKPK